MYVWMCVCVWVCDNTHTDKTYAFTFRDGRNVIIIMNAFIGILIRRNYFCEKCSFCFCLKKFNRNTLRLHLWCKTISIWTRKFISEIHRFPTFNAESYTYFTYYFYNRLAASNKTPTLTTRGSQKFVTFTTALS